MLAVVRLRRQEHNRRNTARVLDPFAGDGGQAIGPDPHERGVMAEDRIEDRHRGSTGFTTGQDAEA